MLTLEHGRPADAAERLPREQRCYDFLDRLGIDYDRVDHDHADTMEVCREIDKTLGATICKNLFLCNRQQTDFYLLAMPDNKRFKTRDLSALLGVSRLSFADAEHMEALLDLTPGSVSVLGLMNDRDRRVQLVLDSPALEREYFGCHPCINTSSLRFKTSDLLEKILPALHHEPIILTLPEPEE